MDTFLLTVAIRGLIAALLAVGGIYAINRGYSLFMNKVGVKESESVFTFGKTSLSVKSIGSLVMLTASFWGYLSVQCVPRTESDSMRVSSISYRDRELAELQDSITRAILTSQDSKMPQTVLQASLKSTLDTPPLVPPKEPRTTEYSYDALGRLSGVSHPYLKTSFTYDAVGNLVAITDPNGRTTTYSYDASGQKLAETRTRSAVTTYTYDSSGRLLKSEVEPRASQPR